MRKVVLAIVDSVRHILCMRFVTQCIYEETRGRNGLYAVTKCAREESEECEKFHFMNVEVQKCFNFLSFALWGRRGTPTLLVCNTCRAVHLKWNILDNSRLTRAHT